MPAKQRGGLENGLLRYHLPCAAFACFPTCLALSAVLPGLVSSSLIQADEPAPASVAVARESCLVVSTQISIGPRLGKAGVDRGGRRHAQTPLLSPAKLLVPAPKCEGARDFAEMVKEFLT